MYDFNGQTSERKLRRFLVTNYPVLEELLQVKQADFSACKDELTEAPTVTRMKTLFAKMQEEKVPFTLKELAISGRDLLRREIPPRHISAILQHLLMHTAVYPTDNVKHRLFRIADGYEKTLQDNE